MGLMQEAKGLQQPQGMPVYWLYYIGVPDLEEAQVEDHG